MPNFDAYAFGSGLGATTRSRPIGGGYTGGTEKLDSEVSRRTWCTRGRVAFPIAVDRIFAASDAVAEAKENLYRARQALARAEEAVQRGLLCGPCFMRRRSCKALCASAWERLVDYFKDSKVLQDEKGEWKVREDAFGSINGSRAVGPDSTVKLTDFEVFRDLSTAVRRALFEDGQLRAEPETKKPLLYIGSGWQLGYLGRLRATTRVFHPPQVQGLWKTPAYGPTANGAYRGESGKELWIAYGLGPFQVRTRATQTKFGRSDLVDGVSTTTAETTVAESERAPKRQRLGEREASAMSDIAEKLLTAGGEVRALFTGNHTAADGLVEELATWAIQRVKKVVKEVMQKARAKAKEMAAGSGIEEGRRRMRTGSEGGC
ncbi:hypothetical protein GGR51DRAFT_567191 [Nemania sp. FL0031]|nr:hypothetical protein GGR51DRAFT_567191 [Nemania sp. FL0031]